MPRRLPSLDELYETMLAACGPQHWWPGESPLEVVVGAVLVQNTAWRNVERAIANLKTHELLDVERLHRAPTEQLETLLQPAGYFRVKTKRLQNVIRFLVDQHGGSLDRLFELSIDDARQQLLSVNGVGPETADSILLYAGSLPRFVVDAYTRRILLRHNWIEPPATYEAMQQLFERRLAPDVDLYNEYHALIVRVGNEYCRAKPKCESCPLRSYLPRSGPCEI
ncbi:endonuclease III domain-containing protein [Aeoliella mucimassa]|uniref:A/G-specific adenine glycosylase n=1 Tax=Aeoliella mucimassa TaxID=2527972 RepID=A0A518AJF6_9BACT|nr:endonuclease III domain-containing protein [Aeoliella mucimassa]QDU54868.1 A/G-specific adenine glycosylase [Aeoliella mucimassa]